MDFSLETVSPSGMFHPFSLGIVEIPLNRAMDRFEAETRNFPFNLGIRRRAAGADRSMI
jgi:hypothetical protein